MTLIKDLIEIPEHVHRDDFVLRLTEGVGRPEETLRNYVVTPQLADCFAQALELISGALRSNSSKAAYLHGSFGSGKSHFMAVLHLLLQQNTIARALEGLEEVVAKQESWLEGKRFLLVPYHMIGQRSMESAVLGGYVRQVRELHPDAPIPGVYLAAGLFRDARSHREDLGDEKFFERLNQAAGGVSDSGGGWGELAAAWNAESFEAAMEAPPESEQRSRLVGALVQTFFQGYQDVARGSEEAFVSLDEGLAIISAHARDLGYDALILFLDELILWLATHAADQAFLNEEGPKVAKLVEAERADRPIPIVSFVARQRDLRDLVGDQVTGAEQLNFADVLQWWEARFQKITLDDRNLPEIASRRILRPKSEAARQEIERAYQETSKVREDVLRTLLTSRANPEAFRKVYPFSPALVDTLVAVSSVLQRERTALKVMLHLLVQKRDSLQLGEVVPVGDLLDVISEGDEPFTEGMRQHFEDARRLYRLKLLPQIERDHGTTAETVAALPADDAVARAFRADDRILKTLLLATLVPEVEVLKGLTGPRLAALNHGSIRTPIPGREGQEVVRRCRRWASQIGEIKVSEEEANPTIALQIASVDTEKILADAGVVDNTGNRRRKIRELLFYSLGIAESEELFLNHQVSWRGTSRLFQVIFANVRELPDESLATRGDERKIVMDFPFDEPGYRPSDDAAKISDFRAAGRPARTLVWLPAFLSESAQRDLGKLVRLDHILAGERFRDYASHLAAVDQVQAKELLRNQRTQLQERFRRVLMGAYGVDHPPAGTVDEDMAPTEHFHVLDQSFEPRPPVGATMQAALEHLLDQMLSVQYPAHPEFGTKVRTGDLRKVHEQVACAIQEPEKRVPIDPKLRPIMHHIAVPLRLGEMGETHFVVDRHWFSHFDKEVTPPRTVERLREAIDRPRRQGLPTEVQDLVILAYADQANLSFRRHGGPWKGGLGDLPDELELREEPLPPQEDWERAIRRAGKIFGLAVSPLLSASNVAELADNLGEKAGASLEAVSAVRERLVSLAQDFGIEDTVPRLRTAQAILALLRGLSGAEGKDRVVRLSTAELATSEDAMATALNKAPQVRRSLEHTKWELFESVGRLTGESGRAAEALREDLIGALSSDEYVVALANTLPDLESRAIKLLSPKPRAPDWRVVDQGGGEKMDADAVGETLREIVDRLEGEPELRAEVDWKLLRRTEGGEE